MTISNSKTLMKLNQIDFENRLNLNWLRKSFVAMTFWSYYYLWHTQIKNEGPFLQPLQIYSRERLSVYLPQQQPVSHILALYKVFSLF